MLIDVNAGADWRKLYQLCLGFINPRPIALVSTVSAAGHLNLAPFSFYNMVSANPPVVMFCPSVRRDGLDKHTFDNVRATGQFVVATVTEAIAEPMVACGVDLPAGENEFDFSGLTPIPAAHIKAPLVKESPVNIECTLRQIITLSEAPGGGRIVLGDIVAAHIADWILDAEGLVDAHKLRTVGRLGGKGYTTVTDPYDLALPTRRA